jgi:hypothetical protein
LNSKKKSGDEKLASSVTLPLAERMISVMEKEKKIKQEQETRLYLMVLELQVSFFYLKKPGYFRI